KREENEPGGQPNILHQSWPGYLDGASPSDLPSVRPPRFLRFACGGWCETIPGLRRRCHPGCTAHVRAVCPAPVQPEPVKQEKSPWACPPGDIHNPVYPQIKIRRNCVRRLPGYRATARFARQFLWCPVLP